MQQRVNFECYLAKTVINLADIKDQNYEAIALPSGAEIMAVNLEVLENANTSLNIGLNDEERFFAADLDINTKGINHNSTKITALNNISKVSIKANKASSKGQIALRVFYFCPSIILTEF